MKKALVFLSIGALVGCFRPVDGDYQLSADGDAVTDCESTDTTFDDEGDPVAVDVNDEKDSMTWGEAQDDVPGWSNECTLDGRNFDCVFYDETGDDGSGNNLSLWVTMSGRWTSNTSVEATVDGGGSCEGDGCSGYEQMGVEFCSTTQDVIGELVE